MDGVRFTTVDPLAEDYYSISPYVYGMNNPLRFTDLTGMNANDTINGGTLNEFLCVVDAPEREPVSGMWGNFVYFLHNGNFDGYYYDKEGNALRKSFIMGDPPGVSKSPFSLKSLKNLTKLFNSSKNVVGFSKTFLSSLSKSISRQKQLRHLVGTTENAKNGGGYMNNLQDAQKVLDAVHSGAAQYLGTTKNGHVVVKYIQVTGTNVNKAAGITNQQTNVFMIKGTASPSVVPINPMWTP
jgi:hypothetical protein